MKRPTVIALLLFCVASLSAPDMYGASNKAPVSNPVLDATAPDTTTTTSNVAAAPVVIDPKSKIPPMGQLLAQGFEIKAAFIDSTNIAYVAMQRGTSAYLCHSGTIPACDKLN